MACGYRGVTYDSYLPLSLSTSLNQAQANARREDVVISISAYRGNYPVAFEDLGGNAALPGILSTFWSVLLANNGDRSVSLVSYEVLAAASQGFMSYSDSTKDSLTRSSRRFSFR